MLGDDIPTNGIAIKINKNDSNFLFIPEKYRSSTTATVIFLI